jgi:very-short-patch-repair endonuclease
MLVKDELKRMQLNFVEEEEFMGRRPDFIIDNDIIIEVDGDIHYDTHTSLEIAKTAVRNYTFLYTGKRLLILKLDEYHVARQNDSISAFIQRKLNLILKDKDILMIK